MEFSSEIVFNAFDNTGKKIHRGTDGDFIRMKFDFKEQGVFKLEP